MFNWLTENLPAALLCAALLALVVLAVVSLVRDKRKGKHSCGGNCSACSLGCACHNKK